MAATFRVAFLAVRVYKAAMVVERGGAAGFNMLQSGVRASGMLGRIGSKIGEGYMPTAEMDFVSTDRQL